MLGFVCDEDGDWVAELDCGHRRHVRHRPPLVSHPWVLSEEGRTAHLGEAIECERCTQRIWPEALVAYKETNEFDERSVPKGLLGDHSTRSGVWGRLEVSRGELALVFDPPIAARVVVQASGWAAIPPQATHHVELMGPVRFRVRFFRRP